MVMPKPIAKILSKLRRKGTTVEPGRSSVGPEQNPTAPQFPLLDLPNDLLVQIAKEHLGARDIKSLAQVNHHFEALMIPLLRQNEAGGVGALHWAAWKGHERIVAILLEQGLDVNDRAVHYCTWTPLHFASRTNENILRLLLEGGADVNAQDRIGCTVLHHAALSQNKERTKVLLKWGADMGLQDVYGRTALHLAAAVGADGVLRVLLDAGADVRIRDLQGKTAFDHAMELGRERCARRLARLEGRKIDNAILYPRPRIYQVCLNQNHILL